MNYVVEARIYDNGKIITKLYGTNEDVGSSCVIGDKCDVWFDVFDSERAAREFLEEYKNA